MKDQYNSKSMGGRGPISTDRNTMKPIRSAHLDICEKQSNSLTPKSDQHLISPNGITPESNIKVMRIQEMEANSTKETLDCRQILLVSSTGNVERTGWRICILM